MKSQQCKIQTGVTLIELLIAIGVISILASTSILILSPQARKAEARDGQRLGDIATLDRAVNEYVLDYGDYPDTIDTLRDSTTLPNTAISLDNSSAGWINADLSEYTSYLPLDPINDDTYKYYYYHDSSGYELNAVMEELTEEAENDGGNDPARYELGNNLLLISP